VGIEYNEKVDFLAKEASIRVELWNNNISCSEIISSFKLEYTNMNNSSNYFAHKNSNRIIKKLSYNLRDIFYFIF